MEASSVLTPAPTLAAFDLDGTLAESKQPLEPEMGGLLAQLMKRMPVAVMSGGSFAQFQKQFFSGLPSHLPPHKLYIFPTNAAQCYVLEGERWQIQYDHSFSEEEKREIFEALNRALAETGLAEEPERIWGERIEDRGAQISFSGLGQEAPIDAKKTWDPDQKKRLAMRNILVPLLPHCSIGIGGMSTIDITKQGITKSYGLKELSRITSIAISDMLYVGDALFPGGNDAVVEETGIRTLTVSGPAETKKYITLLIQ